MSVDLLLCLMRTSIFDIENMALVNNHDNGFLGADFNFSVGISLC